MALAGVHDALQLQPAQRTLLHLVLQMQLIGDIWRLNCCQAGSLNNCVRVLLPVGKLCWLVVCECQPLLVPNLQAQKSSETSTHA